MNQTNQEGAVSPPRAFYASPMDVVSDSTMTVAEKRALLASWASDARAVRDAPALRELDDGAIVFIDDVLDALKQLDLLEPSSGPGRTSQIGRLSGWGQRRSSSRNDDDDDPPPTPAAAWVPRPLPVVDGAYAVAA